MTIDKLDRNTWEVVESYTESEFDAIRSEFSKQIVIHSAWNGRTYEGYKWRINYE
jgi:hypothetical protein